MMFVGETSYTRAGEESTSRLPLFDGVQVWCRFADVTLTYPFVP
jgi:hypothetical protein